MLKSNEDNEFSKLYQQWGLSFIQSKKYELAAKVLKKSAENDENGLKALLGLCEALQKTGNYEEAEIISRKSSQIGM